ncbi:MAG: D-inositol 3-phosphate glycosyltransferase, partial [Candidatus Anoxychlamydiales bacterium]|nr:D-inositol 3-phosphate glycosyltransferase [Candidatus Anoxychlamydiales bacterium]
MKKICIDARMIESAGIGTYLKSLLKNLKSKNFKISLIVKPRVIERVKWLKNFDLIYLDAPIYSIKEQLLLPFKIPKCDLFFVPHFNIPLLPIRAKKRLVTIHDVYHLAFLSSLKFFEKIYAKYFICKAALHSDKIITVSEFSKSEIIKYTKVKSDKIEVIHNAIDRDLFNIKKDEKNTDNIEKKQSENKKKIDKLKILPKKYFLFVGNLKPHKNLINLLKAFEKIHKDFNDIFLVIVGKSANLINAIDIQKVLEKKEFLRKKVIFIDNALDEELPYIYRGAISLVFPSYYEGFGYPPLEAMSVKCPVIASNV